MGRKTKRYGFLTDDQREKLELIGPPDGKTPYAHPAGKANAGFQEARSRAKASAQKCLVDLVSVFYLMEPEWVQDVVLTSQVRELPDAPEEGDLIIVPGQHARSLPEDKLAVTLFEQLLALVANKAGYCTQTFAKGRTTGFYVQRLAGAIQDGLRETDRLEPNPRVEVILTPPRTGTIEGLKMVPWKPVPRPGRKRPGPHVRTATARRAA